MPTTLVTGEVVAAAGDPLVASFAPMVQSIGRIVQVATPAAARALLTTLETAGAAPTSAHPLYFDIEGNLYRSVGSKSSSAWVLSKVDEGEFYEKTFSPSGSWSMAARTGYTDLGSITIPARNYPRRLHAEASLWATVDGPCDVEITALGRTRRGRLSVSSWGNTGEAVVNVTVPQGVSATVSARAVNLGPNNVAVTYGGGGVYNGMTVDLSPITIS